MLDLYYKNLLRDFNNRFVIKKITNLQQIKVIDFKQYIKLL